jgi:hypothetical protein
MWQSGMLKNALWQNTKVFDAFANSCAPNVAAQSKHPDPKGGL